MILYQAIMKTQTKTGKYWRESVGRNKIASNMMNHDTRGVQSKKKHLVLCQNVLEPLVTVCIVKKMTRFFFMEWIFFHVINGDVESDTVK